MAGKKLLQTQHISFFIQWKKMAGEERDTIL
jgi:hypothetical protein